ncbi:uncharacterized protein PAC_01154 [Phialocephala subalpina]|uniref:Uncharacterized protein n=1 Tax=Phialocephala subalpina TaxID=576137 RepID=A0A1L7WEY6_9HELO|nr:uncharacterized protein PAC_01154 [Phialocephala subalpina]
MDPDDLLLNRYVRAVARDSVLPDDPSWDDLQEEVVQFGIARARLQQRRIDVVNLFFEFRTQHRDELLRQSRARLLQPRDMTPSSSRKVRTGADEQRSSTDRKIDSGVYMDEVYQDSDTDADQEEVPVPRQPQPTLDGNNNPKRPTLMSIFLNQKWEGAAVSYCHEDESYISNRIVRRFSVEVVDKKIHATWTFDPKLGKTHHTQFIVIDDNDHDVIFGKLSEDEEFNRGQGVASSANSAEPVLGSCADPATASKRRVTEDWVDKSHPQETKMLTDLIVQLAHRIYMRDNRPP